MKTYKSDQMLPSFRHFLMCVGVYNCSVEKNTQTLCTFKILGTFLLLCFYSR